MKKMILAIGVLAFILIIGLAVYYSDNKSGDVVLSGEGECLAESITQDSFDRYEQTLITAREISGTDLAPLNILNDWTLGDEQVLWQDSTGEIFVDEQMFGDVSVHSATGFGEGEDEVVITTATQELLEKVSPSEIVDALLRTQIIGLYAHLDGSACLVAEETVDGLYIATYEGVHSYCTNECVDDEFSFAVRVNTVSGEITLQLN
ncbi:hypothetical protein HON52_02125 [Candidatus Uhrbacteria bacterium]|jgi:hypothetical protein|nr:hypothetical protein [Candidatus Uhrbacteria bacterium]